MTEHLPKVKRMQVAAVVVTRDRPVLLKQVLDGLRAQTRLPDQLIVVDNASAEPTRILLSQYSDLDIVRLTENTGGAGGFAAGMQHALAIGMDWIWLLDDDAVPHPGALQQLLAALPKLPPPVGAVCSSVEEFGRLALIHRRYFNARYLSEPVVPAPAYQAKAVKIDTGSFVSFLVGADAVRQIGIPDARFFLAYDDTEYSLRLKKGGWSLWLIPASRVQHLRNEQGRLRYGPYGIKHYYHLRNQLIVARQYGSAPGWRYLLLGLRGLLLALVAGRCRAIAISHWWLAIKHSRHEPFVITDSFITQ